MNNYFISILYTGEDTATRSFFRGANDLAALKYACCKVSGMTMQDLAGYNATKIKQLIEEQEDIVEVVVNCSTCKKVFEWE